MKYVPTSSLVHNLDAFGCPAVPPVRRGWDALGRPASVVTSRDGLAWDASLFSHDPATGLRLAKTYADGAAVTNAYTPDGLPLRTVLARGIVRESAYDANRRLASVSYSDGTPGHALSRDALGRVVRVDEGSGRVHQYAYDILHWRHRRMSTTAGPGSSRTRPAFTASAMRR